jgi:hypothetical protein
MLMFVFILKYFEHAQNMYLIQGDLFEYSRSGTCLEFKLILTRGKDWKIPQCKGGGEGRKGTCCIPLAPLKA